MSAANVLIEHENAGQEVTEQVSSGSASVDSDSQTKDPDKKPPYWSTHGLPDAPNSAGRPVWEPPIMDCSEWIGEAYEKKREAMLKFLKGDRASTTELLDIDTEFALFDEYGMWAAHEYGDSRNSESKAFFHALLEEFNEDFWEIQQRWTDLGSYSFHKGEDGTYEVISYQADGDWVYSNTIDDSPCKMGLAGSPISAMEEPRVAEHHRISSPNDEAGELAWLDSRDTSVPSPISSQAPSQHKSTPLALRLLSLRSSADQDTGKNEENYMVAHKDDDLD